MMINMAQATVPMAMAIAPQCLPLETLLVCNSQMTCKIAFVICVREFQDKYSIIKHITNFHFSFGPMRGRTALSPLMQFTKAKRLESAVNCKSTFPFKALSVKGKEGTEASSTSCTVAMARYATTKVHVKLGAAKQNLNVQHLGHICHGSCFL